MATREELLARRKQKVDERNREQAEFSTKQSVKKEWFEKDIKCENIRRFLLEKSKANSINDKVSETSLKLVDVISEAKKWFGITLLLSDLKNIETIKDLEIFIEKKANENNVLVFARTYSTYVVTQSQSSKIVTKDCINDIVTDCYENNTLDDYFIRLQSWLSAFFGDNWVVTEEHLRSYSYSDVVQEILYCLDDRGIPTNSAPRILTFDKMLSILNQCYKSYHGEIDESVSILTTDINWNILKSDIQKRFGIDCELSLPERVLDSAQTWGEVATTIMSFLKKKRVSVDNSISSDYYEERYRNVDKFRPIITGRYIMALFEACKKGKDIKIESDSRTDIIDRAKFANLFKKKIGIDLDSTAIDHFIGTHSIGEDVKMLLSFLCSQNFKTEEGITTRLYETYQKREDLHNYVKDNEESWGWALGALLLGGIPGGLILWGAIAMFNNCTLYSDSGSLTFLGWIAWIIMVIACLILGIAAIFVVWETVTAIITNNKKAELESYKKQLDNLLKQ